MDGRLALSLRSRVTSRTVALCVFECGMPSAKVAVNTVLGRVAGRQIVRNSTLSRLRSESAERAKRAKLAAHRAGVEERRVAAEAKRVRGLKREVSGLVGRLESQMGRIESLTKPAPAPALPGDYDDAMREIWPRVKDRTMTGHQKIFSLIQAVEYLDRHQIPGAIVECGVWRGGSMLAVAEMLVRLGSLDRDLFLFDTYAGMAEPTERDVHIWNGIRAKTLLDDKIGGAPIWEVASLEDVRSAFDAVPYPNSRLHFVEGRVQDTIPDAAPGEIALLRLDTDWYESTRHELEHLYHRLSPGGVLIIDDYGSWQGSKDATDEFLAQTGEPLLLVRVDRGRMAVKPGLPATRS